MNQDGYDLKQLPVRLKEALELVPGDNVEAKAKQLGIPASTLYSYLGGKSLPNLQVLAKLKQETAVNLDWLIFGEGVSATKSQREIIINLMMAISRSLEKYTLDENINLPRYEFVEIVSKIYNFLLFEKFEIKDYDHIIRRAIPLCLGRPYTGPTPRLPGQSERIKD